MTLLQPSMPLVEQFSGPGITDLICSLLPTSSLIFKKWFMYTIYFNSAKSAQSPRKFGLHPTHLSNQPNPTQHYPTNPTQPNPTQHHPTQPNPPSHHLRPRMWSVKNPWCRAKRYVFICTKIVQVLERSNAMSLPKGRIKSSETWNVKCHGLVDGWGGKWK